MRRLLVRISLVLGTLAVVGVALAWSHPELLAALRNWRVLSLEAPGRAGAATEPPAVEEMEASLELVDDGWCLVHDRPESRCPECSSQPGAHPDCTEKLPVIRLAGPDIARRIGLETATIEARQHADVVAGNAEIAYDEHLYAEVLPRVGGVVRNIDADHGRKVRVGDVLCMIDSAEIGSAKAQYLAVLPLVTLGEATLKRTEELTKAKALPLKDELEARTALSRAQAELLNAAQKLRNLGYTDSDLARIERDRDTSSLMPILAPIEGTVIERHMVNGEAVTANHQLVLLADLREMWAWIDVSEGDITRVQTGQPVTLTVTGLEGRVYEGRVHFIDSAVNRVTRTIRVVAEMNNHDGQLRANQFGWAEIVVGEPRTVTLVPRSAVQRHDSFDMVFLPQDDHSYHPQRVLLGAELMPGLIEVRWGIEPGQQVVTTGSFLLKSELVRKTVGLGGDD